MYLKRISGRAIKGGDFDIDLTQANVLTGDNFAGKTRVMDAIRLLLVGYLPELGKTPRATFGLASGPSMTVRGDFDTGETIIRRWYIKGDTVKTEQEFPARLDGADQLLTVMLNAEEYFALTDRERVNYVFANCEIAVDLTRRGIVDRVRTAAPGYEIQDDDLEPELSLQEWIEAKIAAAADAWTNAKANAKRMEETIRGLTALRSADEKGRPVAAIEDAVAAAELKIAELQDRKTALGGKVMAMEAAKLRRAEIVRFLSTYDADRTARGQLEEKRQTIEREIAAITPPARSLIELTQEAERFRGAQATVKKNCDQMAIEIQKLEVQLHGLDAQTECPYCGAKGEGWKALKAAELATAIDTKGNERMKALETAKKLADDYNVALAVRDAAKGTIDRLDHLKAQANGLVTEIARIDQRLERNKALEEERDRLVQVDPQLIAQAEMIQTELNVHRDTTRALQAEIKAALGRAHDLKRLADAEAGRDKAIAEQAAAAAAGKELRKIQGELVELAFKPMLETANRIFGGVLKSPLAYRDGEIGTWRASNWVGHRTMSGTEKLLTYAAIQAALAAKSPVRVMILDELGRITRERAGSVAWATLMAIDAGQIDQFIGIDPERPEIYQNSGDGKLAFQIIPIQ